MGEGKDPPELKASRQRGPAWNSRAARRMSLFIASHTSERALQTQRRWVRCPEPGQKSFWKMMTPLKNGLSWWLRK